MTNIGLPEWTRCSADRGPLLLSTFLDYALLPCETCEFYNAEDGFLTLGPPQGAPS